MVKDGKFKGNFFKKLIKDEYYRSVEYLKQFSWSECKYELKSTFTLLWRFDDDICVVKKLVKINQFILILFLAVILPQNQPRCQIDIWKYRELVFIVMWWIIVCMS